MILMCTKKRFSIPPYTKDSNPVRTICKIIIGSKKNLKLTVNLREKLVIIVVISHSAIISGGEVR